ncbi:unnamed protein product [Leptosia nina]|uniref:Uncharacterized protein n=1 Tax=Leptosia nina TaxID=320188 RepID=A0AAV1JIP5_9NEOP
MNKDAHHLLRAWRPCLKLDCSLTSSCCAIHDLKRTFIRHIGVNLPSFGCQSQILIQSPKLRQFFCAR